MMKALKFFFTVWLLIFIGCSESPFEPKAVYAGTLTIGYNQGSSGRTFVQSSSSFVGARDATEGTPSGTYFGVGGLRPSGNWNNIRGHLTFVTDTISLSGIVVDSAYVLITWTENGSTTDFSYLLCDATNSGSAVDYGWHIDFTNWGASGAYSNLTIYSDSLNSVDFLGTVDTFRLNPSGITALTNAIGSDSLRFTLLSLEDINNSEPAGSEYMQLIFKHISGTGDVNLKIFYSSIGWTGSINGVVDPESVNGVAKSSIQSVTGIQ